MSVTHIRIGRINQLRVMGSNDHWAKKYPNLAAYLAGDMSENSGIEAVEDELKATPEEAQHAENQLREFASLRICFDMGYHKLQPQEHVLVDGPEFMASEIAGRYY